MSDSDDLGEGYLECPSCKGRLSTWNRAGKVIVSCEMCDYVGFEIVGLTQKFLRQFKTRRGVLGVQVIKKEED